MSPRSQRLVPRQSLLWIILFAVLAALLLTAATTEAAPAQACGSYHQVQRGETLYSISRHYGVPIAALMRANPSIHNPNRIYAGSWIYIPCAPGGGTGGMCSTIHRVAFGETLNQIALRYHVSPHAIARANNIHNPNLIYAGSSLCIP